MFRNLCLLFNSRLFDSLSGFCSVIHEGANSTSAMWFYTVNTIKLLPLTSKSSFHHWLILRLNVTICQKKSILGFNNAYMKNSSGSSVVLSWWGFLLLFSGFLFSYTFTLTDFFLQVPRFFFTARCTLVLHKKLKCKPPCCAQFWLQV